MVENEAMAHELVSRLRSADLAARATGGGVHWQVDVGPMASRSVRVHCFWYERALSGIVIGMNPANARSRLRGVPVPYEGPEYLVILYGDAVRIADGRTRESADVVGCAREWLASGDLDCVVEMAPFIDEKARAMRAVARGLDPQVRWKIGNEPGYELWAYGEGRSCKVEGSGTLACSFLLGQAQVAYGGALGDVASAVSAWLVDRMPLRALAERVRGVELERHAEVLETEPARWHWLHVRDRLADPDDALTPLRELIEALTASRIATTFYTYSSLYRLCFSASSHYPWVDEGLPVVTPTTQPGTYSVDDTLCDLGHAIQLIESKLSATPLRPFFGSAPHHEMPRLNELLARSSSGLYPQLVQCGALYALAVADASGAKRCEVDGRSVTFADGTDRLNVTWRALEDAVSAICRYCEGSASLNELAADARARHVLRYPPTSG
jgi:hypothetical protein